MSLFFPLLLLLSLIVFGRSPAELTRLNNPPFTLIVFVGPVSWSTAEAVCRANGMSIASIHSLEENMKIVTLLRSVVWPQRVWHGAWIGLTDEGSEGRWRWVDGTPLDFTNFGPGEPNGGTYENYGAIELARAGRPDGWWNDANMNEKYAAVVCRAGAVVKTPKASGLLPGMEPDTDRPGMDYTSFDLPYADPKLCMEACNRDPRCRAWTYVKPNTIQGPRPRCWLKHSVPPPKPHYCCVSGVKGGASATPALPSVDVGNLARLLHRQGIRGGQFYSIGKPVKVTILPSDAGYTSELWLVSPVEKYIGTNREAWKTVDVGVFPAGSELIFELRVRNTGRRFRTGPASRNPDSLVHAALYSLEQGKVVFGFEDMFGGGDRDFNDCMFLIEGVSLTPIGARTVNPTPPPTATSPPMPQAPPPAPVLRAQPVQRKAKVKCIESVGVGEASVIKGDRASAKAEALARAKWDAIEKALGVTTSVKTIVHNFRLLDEVIKNEVGGFIRDVKILKEENFSDMVRVKVKGCVYPNEAERALSMISRDTAFSVLIITKSPSGVELDEMNPVTTELVNLLNQQGFKVYDFAGNPNVNPYDIEAIVVQRKFIALRAYMSRVLSGAMIVGKVELVPSTTTGQDIGYGIRATFNVVTARLNYYLLARDEKGVRIVASGSLSALGRAPNLRDAQYRAMEALAKKLGSDIMGKIERYRASKKKVVTVVVRGVKKTTQNFAIKEKLQRVPWVQSVEDLGLGRFKVIYLENTVYLANAIERIPELELIRFSPTEVEARLI